MNLKNKSEIMSAITDVQLGANTVARRRSALSEDVCEQLDRDLCCCQWFSMRCDESVDSSDAA
ncbi:hypothetical protein EOD39_14145 [Acipenser ruthenus]|uniref:Uncharacterized protein n=1 Tax=Acipenser ruthenus TaxID=7906 RepID=A0A444UGP3_ACIRT|nr:hypothetical protein EOD39_14145 [Acipenser ruthenus]